MRGAVVERAGCSEESLKHCQAGTAAAVKPAAAHWSSHGAVQVREELTRGPEPAGWGSSSQAGLQVYQKQP